MSVGAQPLTDSVSVPLILSHAKASLFIQSFRDTHLHCVKILAAYLIYSTFLLDLFRNVLMWAHFHFGEGLFFPRSRPQAPCLTPLRLFVCIFELNIKSAFASSFLLLPLFNSPHLQFRGGPGNLLPSSSAQCC